MQLTRLKETHDFNPHHPEGGDVRRGQALDRNKISIHTTPKVVTGWLIVLFASTVISIHTTPKVVTKQDAIDARKEAISIHTTPKVVTIWCRKRILQPLYFNPHHPEGGDSKFSQKTIHFL